MYILYIYACMYIHLDSQIAIRENYPYGETQNYLI